MLHIEILFYITIKILFYKKYNAITERLRYYFTKKYNAITERLRYYVT